MTEEKQFGLRIPEIDSLVSNAAWVQFSQCYRLATLGIHLNSLEAGRQSTVGN